MAKIKTINDYRGTWNKINKDPRAFLNKYVKFQNTGKPIPPADGVFMIGSTTRSANNYKAFHQCVDEVNRIAARIILEQFITVHQRLPKTGEQILCTIFFNTETLHKGKDQTISFVGQILPKV